MNDLTHPHLLRPFYSFLFINYTPLEICFVHAKRCWFGRESRYHIQIHVDETTTANSCWALKAFWSPLTINRQLITTSTMHIEIIIVPALLSPWLIVLQILDPKYETFLFPPLYPHQARGCMTHEIFSFSQSSDVWVGCQGKTGEELNLIYTFKHIL